MTEKAKENNYCTAHTSGLKKRTGKWGKQYNGKMAGEEKEGMQAGNTGQMRMRL